MTGPVGGAEPPRVCLFCSQNDSHSFILHPVSLQQLRLSQGCETQTAVSDVGYNTPVQQEQMKLFDVFYSYGFEREQSFVHLSFVYLHNVR